ncbi:MAG TPA: permease-like cell division protein FtsX [Gammaproteobacteria bacterium]
MSPAQAKRKKQKPQVSENAVPRRKRKVDFRLAIKSWLAQHAQALISSFGQLFRNPVGSALTIAVIGISLALPAGFYVLLENARLISAGWEGSVEITAFLKKDISDATGQKLQQELQSQDNIEKVIFINRDKALEEYRQLSGFGDAIDALEENPLPSLLLIKPATDDKDAATIEQLVKQLSERREVDKAQYDQKWVQRLNAIISIIQRVVVMLAVFLGLAVLLIVGNTIRMSIYNRRAEIEVEKLFGATNAFIQRPFVYSGLWYGLGGGLFAWCLVTLALFFLQSPTDTLAQLYQSNFSLRGLAFDRALTLLAAGILLGSAGSWLSVQRHLRAIEPA